MKERAKMSEPTGRKRYPSDLTDAQWKRIELFIPKVSRYIAVPAIERRELVNGIYHELGGLFSDRSIPLMLSQLFPFRY